MCAPSAVLAVFHETDHGDIVSSTPRFAPSRRNWTATAVPLADEDDAVGYGRRRVRLGVSSDRGAPRDLQRAIRLHLQPHDPGCDTGDAAAGVRYEDHSARGPVRRDAADAAAPEPVV